MCLRVTVDSEISHILRGRRKRTTSCACTINSRKCLLWRTPFLRHLKAKILFRTAQYMEFLRGVQLNAALQINVRKSLLGEWISISRWREETTDQQFIAFLHPLCPSLYSCYISVCVADQKASITRTDVCAHCPLKCSFYPLNPALFMWQGCWKCWEKMFVCCCFMS